MIPFSPPTNPPMRPMVMAKRHAISSGHYWASLAGLEILEAGGNAIDAGVAASLACNVLEPTMCNFLGTATLLLNLQPSNEMVSVVGNGPWPKTLSAEYFRKNFGGRVPYGVLRSVVPAAPDNYFTVLERYGTMTFSDVVKYAIRFAEGGFPVYHEMRNRLFWALNESGEYLACPENDTVFRPNGRFPEIGELFVQPALARMLRYVADEEKAHSAKGRAHGFQAARNAVYRGDIARAIVKQQEDNGGQLSFSDLADFRADFETPCKRRFHGIDVYAGGEWCQGPMLLHALGLLEGFDLKSLGHNSAAYLHLVAEALKVAQADRESHFGDPKFNQTPIDEYLSDAYIATRRKLIRTDTAWKELPPAGTLGGFTPGSWEPDPSSADPVGSENQPRDDTGETTYLCVIDKQGNIFSGTISCDLLQGPIIPELGVPCSCWGTRAYTSPTHPARVEPGKRPRMSTAPQIAVWPDGRKMGFGSPGSEVLGQAQVQVFLNSVVFGMDPQTAAEAPRVASFSWPESPMPHKYQPGQLNVEGFIGREVGDELARLGHKIEWWPGRSRVNGSVCAIQREADGSMLYAGADPRKTAYAIGW